MTPHSTAFFNIVFSTVSTLFTVFDDFGASRQWDLVVCDEAHKMSATFFAGEVKYAKRYKLGQLLSGVTRHVLLMTATPHNGKEEDFQLFMALLDRDRFEGKFRDGVHVTDVSDLMRRMVKEKLLKFDGTPLFPQRFANTLPYKLSDPEAQLYKMVTDYVRQVLFVAELGFVSWPNTCCRSRFRPASFVATSRADMPAVQGQGRRSYRPPGDGRLCPNRHGELACRERAGALHLSRRRRGTAGRRAWPRGRHRAADARTPRAAGGVSCVKTDILGRIAITTRQPGLRQPRPADSPEGAGGAG
jgi:hypothetical protein